MPYALRLVPVLERVVEGEALNAAGGITYHPVTWVGGWAIAACFVSGRRVYSTALRTRAAILRSHDNRRSVGVMPLPCALRLMPASEWVVEGEALNAVRDTTYLSFFGAGGRVRKETDQERDGQKSGLRVCESD